ncbi:MAG: adenylate kinase [Chloroflexi bacterium]|nr:adenylate kinase [Chloroflexota bacterium]
MYIILLGPPGAGKGTQAQELARSLGVPHVASGELLREARQKGTELGLKAGSYMDKGLLVPNEIIVGIFLERLGQPDADKGAVLDGFPRSQDQARILEKALKSRERDIGKVIYMRVSNQELIRRLAGRWLCRRCQTPYHTVSSPPKVAGHCDVCGGELYQRSDDKEETVRKRLDVYHQETAPLVEYYRKQGNLVEVEGEGNIEAVSRALLALVA